MGVGKRAEMSWGEILGLILAVVVVSGLAWLLFRLLMPSFDVNDETARSYFDSFLEGVDVADSGGDGAFLMWQPEENVNFYVVYFGDRKVVESDVEFFLLRNNENAVCLCYVEGGESFCKYCKNLRSPVIYDGSDASETWTISAQERVKITKGEGFYEIVNV
jgi:hypothetical protein